MKTPMRSLLYLLLIALLFSACSDPTPPTSDAQTTRDIRANPTQDVGEETPTYHTAEDVVRTPTFTIPAPLTDPKATGATVIGPAAYPTPGDQITPWDQLIDRNLLGGTDWATYQGMFQGSDKSTYWSYSFCYPADFYPSDQASLNQGYVQSIPPMQKQPLQGEFIKFEVVRLKDPPVIEDGEALNPHNLYTVIVAGQPGILRIKAQLPDQSRIVSIVFKYEGSWVAAAGYINLPSAAPSSIETWTTVIYAIMSTFDLQGP